jgi:hypothetical protein
MERPEKPINLRLQLRPADYQKLAHVAVRERRAIPSQAEYVLERWLKRQMAPERHSTEVSGGSAAA